MRKFHGISSQVYVDELLDIIKKLYQYYVVAAPSTMRPTSGSNDDKESGLLQGEEIRMLVQLLVILKLLRLLFQT